MRKKKNQMVSLDLLGEIYLLSLISLGKLAQMVSFDLSNEIYTLSSSLSVLWSAVMLWSFEFEKRYKIFRLGQV